MEIFLYEFVTGGGLLESGEIPGSSLLTEGSAMIRAFADDLTRVVGVHVIRMQDARVDLPVRDGEQVHVVDKASDERLQFLQLARSADWTIVIAPEIDGVLLRRINAVRNAGGRVVGGSLEFVELVSNKQQTSEHLATAGIPVPDGVFLPVGSRLPLDICYPAVMKPVDGAGSGDVRLVQSGGDLFNRPIERDSRIEKYLEGLPVSVALLTGPGDSVPLLPCRQQVIPPDFHYGGGHLPLKPSLAARATELALAALNVLPPSLGYVGIDMVLGSDTSGHQDVVIEINPRLTTSYVGLRRATRDNLAQVMMETAIGQTPQEITFDFKPIDFSADGTVRVSDPVAPLFFTPNSE